MIEKITRVPLRSVWKHEAKEFTVWLQQNIDVLNDILGFELLNVEKEQSTGNFNVDLLAEDTSGNIVIIENQLECSDHRHLGQIITYLTSFEAKKAIWIVSEPKQEHINAISWLNSSSDCEFYFIKVEGIKIGDSSPAPLLTLIVGPSEEAKEAGTFKKEVSERHRLRYKFWETLLESSKSKHLLFNSISPKEYNWIGVSSGIRGINYNYAVTIDGVKIYIYIDRGKGCEQENINIFNQLLSQKEEIERIFGEQFNWNELPGSRACSISKEYKSGGWRSEESTWDHAQNEAIDAMVRLEKATKHIINNLNI